MKKTDSAAHAVLTHHGKTQHHENNADRQAEICFLFRNIVWPHTKSPLFRHSLRLPDGRTPARKHQTGFRYRQADLIGGNLSAEFFADENAEQILHHRRGKPRGVGIQQEEQRFLRQNRQAHLHQPVNLLLKLPDFSVRAAPVGRRVHDDARRKCCRAAARAERIFHSRPQASAPGGPQGRKPRRSHAPTSPCRAKRPHGRPARPRRGRQASPRPCSRKGSAPSPAGPPTGFSSAQNPS